MPATEGENTTTLVPERRLLVHFKQTNHTEVNANIFKIAKYEAEQPVKQWLVFISTHAEYLLNEGMLYHQQSSAFL